MELERGQTLQSIRRFTFDSNLEVLVSFSAVQSGGDKTTGMKGGDYIAARGTRFMESAPVRNKIPRSFRIAFLILALAIGVYYWRNFGSASTPSEPDSSDVQGLLSRGIELHNQHHYEEAISLYLKVLQKDPSNAFAHYNLGQIYNERGQSDLAIAEYEATLKADPNSAAAHLNLGVIFFNRRDFTRALAEFSKTLETEPNNPLALYDAGLVYGELGQAAMAEQFLENSLKADPNQALPNFHLGLISLKQNKAAKARDYFERVTVLNPNFAEAFLNLGRAYQKLGQTQKAADATRHALVLNPGLKDKARAANERE